jgi:hypothetical protein
VKTLPTMTPVEAERFVRLANMLREVLVRWKKKAGVPRGEGLCACLVLVGNEAGLEGALSREQFLAYAGEIAGWAYDLGEQARHDREREKAAGRS